MFPHAALADTSHRWLLVVVLAVVAVSRLLLIPGVPWEQDEALFGAAAFDTDIVEHRPHPPGFPLWTGLAHLGRLTCGDPVLFLQLTSAALSVVSVWALYLLWRQILGDALSLAAAAGFAFLPAVWFHAARAFSTTPALAVALCALLVLRLPGRAGLVGGATLLAAATLVRPVLGPVFALAGVAACWLRRDRITRVLWAAGAAAGVLALGFAPLVVDTGGIGPFLAALGEHGSGHAGALHLASWALPGLGIVKGIGGVVPFVVLLGSAILGLISLRDRRLAVALAGGAVIVAAWVLLAHNRTYVRYTIPFWALLCGPAVLGVAKVTGRRWAAAIATAAAVVAGVASAPAVATVASAPFPPLQAMETAANQGVASVVVDGGLSPFGDLLNLARRGPERTVWRPLVADGRITPRDLPSPLGVVWAAPTPRRWIRPPLRDPRVFRCADPAVRRLSQGRYLDAWLGVGGALVLEPADALVAPDGSIDVGDGLTLLTSRRPGPNRLGLRLLLRRPATLQLEVDGAVVQAGALPTGRHVVAPPLPPRTGPGGSTLTVARLTAGAGDGAPNAPGAVLLDRTWTEPLSSGARPAVVAPSELSGGLDGLVFSTGLFDLESLGDPARPGRWSTGRAEVSMPLAGGVLRIALVAPRPEPARVRLSVPPSATEIDVTVGSRWRTVTVPVPPRNHRLLRIEVANPFVPAEKTPSSRDTRELGVVVGRIEIDST